MDRIKLKCKNCDGLLEVDEDKELLHCPYCGSDEIINLADEVAIQKIKSKTEKEIKFREMDIQAEREKKAEQKESINEYKKGKLGKFTIAFAIICFIVAIGSFLNGDVLAGIVALIQAGLAGASWAMGAKLIEEPKPNMKMITFAVSLVLIILWAIFTGVSGTSESNVDDNDYDENYSQLVELTTDSDIATTTEEVSTEEKSSVEKTNKVETTTEKETTKKTSGVTPELKEFLNSYEAFVDEYIAFMKSYDSNDPALLMKYSSLVAKEAEFAEKANKYDTSSMSDEDYDYYIKAMNRINAKLANAAVTM